MRPAAALGLALAALGLTIGATAPAPGRLCEARAFGARGDGIAIDTAAIQRAIDTCANVGGGRVELRDGTFLSGTLVLKDHIVLAIARGATLRGSPRIDDYRPFPSEDVAKIAVEGSTQSKGNGPYHLIHAEGAVDIAIEGGGTIDGNGAAFWDEGPAGDPVSRRPRPSPLIEFVASRGIRIEGVTIRNAPGWTIHPLESSDIRFDRTVIRNDPKGPNTDAIDIDSSRNVVVSNADIIAGDDCVVLKTTGRRSTRPVPATENVLITRIRCSSDDQGIKIGTESLGDFRNIVIAGGVIYRAPSVYRPPTAGISLSMVDGAQFDRVVVRDIVIDGAVTPLFLRLGNRGRGQATPVPGKLSSVSFSNIRAVGGSLASSITGLPGHPLLAVTLRNVTIEMTGGASEPFVGSVPEVPGDYPHAPMFGPLPASALYIRHVDGLTLANVRLRVRSPDARPLAVLDDVSRLRADRVSRTWLAR
jgi:polygalacturonase